MTNKKRNLLISFFISVCGSVLLFVVVRGFVGRRQPTVELPVENEQQGLLLRVLFIGNSYTFYNNLPMVLSRLAVSAEKSITIQAAQYVREGYTLRDHWRNGEALILIQKYRWDFVVLQEASMPALEEPNQMREFASKFDGKIRAAGSQTVLFMTWARKNRPKMINEASRVYSSVGKEIGALVVPVGLAWDRAIREKPDLQLYTEDGSHPNQQGTYLAACVFFTALTGESPLGLSNASVVQVTEEQAAFLQQTAWQTVAAHLQQKKRMDTDCGRR